MEFKARNLHRSNFAFEWLVLGAQTGPELFDLGFNHFQYFDAINTDIEFFCDGPIFGQVKDFLVQFCSDGFKRFLHRFKRRGKCSKSPLRLHRSEQFDD